MKSPLDLTALLRQYVLDHPNLSPGYQVDMAVSVRRYSAYLGRPATTSDLQRSTLLEWLSHLKNAGKSAHTINNRRMTLVTLWNYAAELELVKAPDRKIPKLAEPRRLPVVWKLEEVNRLFTACSKERGVWDGRPASTFWQAILLLLWDSGCRLSEVRLARVSQVLLDQGLFYSPAEHRKGRREDRLYRLAPQTVLAIAATLPRPADSPLFPYPRHWRYLWIELKQILAAAGLPRDRLHMFHCIRRTAESYAAASRGLEWAAAAVGHSPDVAKKYYVSPSIAPGPSLVDALPRPAADVREPGLLVEPVSEVTPPKPVAAAADVTPRHCMQSIIAGAPVLVCLSDPFADQAGGEQPADRRAGP